jgi:NADPH:quinone reductase
LHAKKGEYLLIRRGTSIVGLATAKLAKPYGLQVYSATRSSEKVIKFSPLAGDGGHVIMYDGKISNEVLKQTDGQGG